MSTDPTAFDPHDGDEEETDPRHLAPLEVDPAPLHAMVDELTACLHRYVDTAVGIRAEFASATAEDDPRIEAVEEEIARLNAAISERFETDLGLVSGHTIEAWEEDEESDDDADDEHEDGAVVFDMEFLVAPGIEGTEERLDEAFSILEEGGNTIASSLIGAGFTVRQWELSRDAVYGDDDDTEDED